MKASQHMKASDQAGKHEGKKAEGKQASSTFNIMWLPSKIYLSNSLSSSNPIFFNTFTQDVSWLLKLHIVGADRLVIPTGEVAQCIACTIDQHFQSLNEILTLFVLQKWVGWSLQLTPYQRILTFHHTLYYFTCLIR